MARIRTIKPEYWKSERLACCCPGPDGREARRLFIALWNLAEDHGVCRGNPSYVRSEVYPYDDDVAVGDVVRWLALLEAGGFIVRFQRDGSSYLWIRGFADHQKIDRPSRTSLPLPSVEEQTRRGLDEGSTNAQRGLAVGREGKGREEDVEAPRVPAPAPTVQKPASATAPAPARATPPDIAFFAWAQEERFRRFPQAMPDHPPAGFERWHFRAKGEAGSEERLRAAWRAWLDEPFAATVKPPASMQVFTGSDKKPGVWRKHVPDQTAGPPKWELRPGDDPYADEGGGPRATPEPVRPRS